MSSDKPIPSSEICSVENCGKPVDSRGFCTACYYRNLRNKTIKKNEVTKYKKHILENIDTEKKNSNL
jgi:hypothetical protein